MLGERMTLHSHSGAGASPWTGSRRLLIFLWDIAWHLLCRWTPKPMNGWRLRILRLFGARVHGRPFVHQRARILFPWNIELHDRACIGDGANLYSLDAITIGEDSIIAQEAYLCAGTHSVTDPGWPLVTAPIHIGSRVFVGARAFIMPGINIGDVAVVGACSVVTKDVAHDTTVAGNPAKQISPP